MPISSAVSEPKSQSSKRPPFTRIPPPLDETCPARSPALVLSNCLSCRTVGWFKEGPRHLQLTALHECCEIRPKPAGRPVGINENAKSIAEAQDEARRRLELGPACADHLQGPVTLLSAHDSFRVAGLCRRPGSDHPIAWFMGRAYCARGHADERWRLAAGDRRLCVGDAWRGRLCECCRYACAAWHTNCACRAACHHHRSSRLCGGSQSELSRRAFYGHHRAPHFNATRRRSDRIRDVSAARGG